MPQLLPSLRPFGSKQPRYRLGSVEHPFKRNHRLIEFWLIDRGHHVSYDQDHWTWFALVGWEGNLPLIEGEQERTQCGIHTGPRTVPMHEQLRCFDENLIFGDLHKEGWFTIHPEGSGVAGTRFANEPTIEVFAEHRPKSVYQLGDPEYLHMEFEGKMLIRQTGGLDV